MHSFWCMVERFALRKIVKGVRKDLLRMEGSRPTPETSPDESEEWFERSNRLKDFLTGEQMRLFIIGG